MTSLPVLRYGAVVEKGGLKILSMPLFSATNWHLKRFEIQRLRDPARHRKWRVEHSITHDAYEIIPGSNDGVATASPDWPFPKGDVWILRYHPNELDDGVATLGPPYEADLDRFVNGESVQDQDVVFWYAAHFTHDLAHEDPATHGHRVGPDIKRADRIRIPDRITRH